MIILKQVRLVNWYGFNQITVPIGLFTLIAGKMEMVNLCYLTRLNMHYMEIPYSISQLKIREVEPCRHIREDYWMQLRVLL